MVVYCAPDNPHFSARCEEAISFSEEFLKRWLPVGVLKNNQQRVQEVIDALIRGTKYKLHGQVIDYKEARSLGLNVEYIEPQSELWNLLWELYVR